MNLFLLALFLIRLGQAWGKPWPTACWAETKAGSSSPLSWALGPGRVLSGWGWELGGRSPCWGTG